VSRTYDNEFRISSLSINGGNTINFKYDNDGLLIQAGDLLLSRDTKNGLAMGIALGRVTTAWGYNGFGESVSSSAAYNGMAFYTAQYTRDKLGRITQKAETIAGMTDTYSYTYDLAGRLAEVKKNGARIATYTYDSNGNRLSYTGLSSTRNSTYDNQDRLTQSGSTTYTYTANGDLLRKTVGGQTTSYQYDGLGNLMAVTLPNGTQIEYLVDGQNRRLGKRVNGILVQGFLYQDKLRPVAELDGNNNVVSHFIYASRGSLPDYMVKNGITYRIIADHVRSPRLVVNVTTGQIVQRMDYDEFGNVIVDTNPGFQPFGFGGGLYDRDTGLVRFGVRDYDPETGRWTTPDPIRFDGGQPNLYVYVHNDPVNLLDPSGLQGTKLREFDPERNKVRSAYKNAEKAAKATDAIVNDWLKDGKGTDREEFARKELLKKFQNPERKEYEDLLKQAEETGEKGVDPIGKKFRELFRKINKALCGGEGEPPPEQQRSSQQKKLPNTKLPPGYNPDPRSQY
jgi:RHS repeat-associated protein